MSLSESVSTYSHGIRIDISDDPPPYNDVIKISHLPTAPPLEASVEGTQFSSIFGGATTVQFEYNTSSIGSFLIRGYDGSLQAKGDVNSHHIVVQNVNGMEMLKIIERSVDQVNGAPVQTLGVVHNHTSLGTIKVTHSLSPRRSLQMFRENGTPITVTSFKIGDYAVFRDSLPATPMCNIQMPDVEVSTSPTEFNVKIIFHPQTGITEEEQLLCTAAAIAFKTTIKEKVAEDDRYAGTIFCIFTVIGIVVLLVIAMLRKYD